MTWLQYSLFLVVVHRFGDITRVAALRSADDFTRVAKPLEQDEEQLPHVLYVSREENPESTRAQPPSELQLSSAVNTATLPSTVRADDAQNTSGELAAAQTLDRQPSPSRSGGDLESRGDASSGDILSMETLKNCSFEVIMFDTRDLASNHDPEELQKEQKIYNFATVLNYAYARRHGYNFLYVRSTEPASKELRVTWRRWAYLVDHLADLQSSGRCTWMLVLDSDAFVREEELPIDMFLADIGRRYSVPATTGGVMARERKVWKASKAQSSHPETHEWYSLENKEYKSYGWVNPGVAIFNAASEPLRQLVETMSTAPEHISCCKVGWPTDMAVLSELLDPGFYPLARIQGRETNATAVSGTISLVDMLEMNCPFGRFVSHVWSGWGKDMRQTAFKDALLRIDAWNVDRFSSLIGEIKNEHSSEWLGPQQRH